jgi:hypothetical protein
MSLVSTWFHKLADIVTNAVQKAPADQQAPINDAASQLRAAAQATEAALPVAVKIGVDLMLADFGWGAYIPNANGFLDLVIADLTARKSKAA